MPGRVSVKVIAARNLPVMDRASEACDAFTEVRLGQVCFKTEIYRKSLNPKWASEWFRFEVDDEALQDERLQLRVMDYDTYSANDAIGKVYIDLNYLLRENNCVMQGWLPIYDTLHGIRGEINVTVKVDLISDANKYRVSSAGMRVFYSDRIPDGLRLASVQGFTEELIAGDDPEFHWMDRIRTPRASNETRQALFARFSGQLQRRVGLKALELGGNAVLGYQQYFDIEGDTGIVVRGIGTAVKLVEAEDDPTAAPQSGRSLMSEDMAEYPFITMKVVPPGLIEGIGGLVSARSVKLLDESEAETRDSWWTELRKEIRSHAKSFGCNIVVGYTETTTICEDVLLMSACGTAALLSSPHHVNLPPCGLCHAPYKSSSAPFKSPLNQCECCQYGKVPDVLFMTIEPPPTLGMTGKPYLIQARVCKTKKDLKNEASAKEIGDVLPFLEYELHKSLLANMKKLGLNAILRLNVQVSIGEHYVTGLAVGTACAVAALPQSGKQVAQPVCGSLSESEDDDILSSSFKQRLCIMNLDHSDSSLQSGSETCIIRQPPEGFSILSTETPLSYDSTKLHSTQLIMQAFRFRPQQNLTQSSLGACTPPSQATLDHDFSRHLDRILQNLFVRLRKYRPCHISGLQFKTIFPQADEIQVAVMGSVMYNDESESVGVEVSTLSDLPGRAVRSYLGNVNFFLIRETTNMNQSLNAFVATFLNEVLAIARCHVSALGGNALLSLRVDHQLLLHGTHKHQGQCLVCLQGDAVLVEKINSLSDPEEPTHCSG